MSRLPKTTAIYFLSFAAAGALLWMFQINTRVLNPSGKWFSDHLAFRYQTESFFNGSLSLQNHPFFHERDWAWGHGGMHQPWGLGVPLLRFPFEAAAKLFGQPGFPDRLVFVFLYFAVAFLYLQFFLSQLTDRWRTIATIEKIFFAGVLMLFPAYVNLVASRFQIYEETIAYLALWALLLVNMLFRFEVSSSHKLFLALALLAGFAPAIRPTGIFYGVITFALAWWASIKHRHDTAIRAKAMLLFLLGPTLVLLTNQLRFGHPFEFGYKLNMSMVFLNDYALRFGYPFQTEPFWSAARELFTSLFMCENYNGLSFYFRGHPWFSTTLRFREYYLPSYGTVVLAICGACWLIFPWSFFDKVKSRWISTGFLWSALCFTALSLFYLRAPALTSRYIVDFFPAIGITVIAFLGCVLAIIEHRLKNNFIQVAKHGLIAIVMGMLFITLREDKKTFLAKYIPRPTLDARDIQSRLRNFEKIQAKATELKVPNRYECPSDGNNFDIEANFSSWQIKSTCYVVPITTVFLNASQGVELVFSRISIAPNSDIAEDVLNDIKVRSGLEFLEKKSISKEGDNYRALYCGKGPSGGTQMVSVGWIPPENLGRDAYAPVFRLYSIEGKNCGQ